MNINCGKCGKLMNITEHQNYGENGGEHVACPMSWQEEYTKRYEGMLAERWGVDGHPLNEHRRTKEVRMLWEASQKAHWQTQSPSSSTTTDYRAWAEWGAVKEQD